MKHVLVTGSREWDDYEIVRQALLEYAYRADTLIHGSARGADTLADEWATVHNEFLDSIGVDLLNVERFPVTSQDWDLLGKAAGHIRNGKMLQRLLELRGDKIVLAFYKGRLSKGTQGMIDKARAAGVDTLVYYRA